MIGLLRRAIQQSLGAPVLNWINPQIWGVSNHGINITGITWLANSASDIGQKIEFDVKFNKGSYSVRECLLGLGGGNNSTVMLVLNSNLVVFDNASWTITGLNLFDGEFHHIKMEKTSATQTTLTVDAFTPVAQAIGGGDKTISNLTSGAITTGYAGLDGIMKNFVATNASSTVTHDMPINDGSGSSTIANSGTTADGTLVGIENTDYQWE